MNTAWSSARILRACSARIGTSTAIGAETCSQALASSQPTLQDLINRTYLMSLSYINPRIALDRGHWPALSSLGQQPGNHRWRIFWRQVLVASR